MLTALQSTALPLVIEFSFTKEIEDRLLAPIPVALVAVEKMVFAAMRALDRGALHVPDRDPDPRLGAVAGGRRAALRRHPLLGTLVGAAMGLTMGTLVPPNRITVMFTLVLTPLLFTGCSQYPWPSLARCAGSRS